MYYIYLVRLLFLFIPTILTRMPLSDRHPFNLNLCGDDFYPLIHICTKEMTYDEKVVYRAKHCIPGTIDKWIADEKMHTKAPTSDPHNRGPSLKYLLWQDDVECILIVIRKEVGK
jgi:hypothetical protein